MAAAEHLVLQEGVHAVSIRRIAARSGLNSALVSYHFGSLAGLERRLLEANVYGICDARDALIAEALAEPDGERRLRALVAAYLDPLWRTGAAWNPGSARAGVREVMPILAPEDTQACVRRINESVAASADSLAPLLPHLTRERLLARLRLLAGAADMMRPRLEEMGLYPRRGGPSLNDELLELSIGALRAP